MAVQHLHGEAVAPDRAPRAEVKPMRPTLVRRRRLALFAALAAAGVAASGGWWWMRPVTVSVAAVSRGEAVDTVYASGVVEYVRQARLAPVVTAPIRQVLVQEGQAVRAGQALVQLDDGPQLGATLQLEAQADLARAEARRTERLFQAGFAAPAAREDSARRLAAAEGAARGARAHLSDYRIKAPFAGRLLRRDAEPGDLAAAGKPLLVVADPSALRVTADIDERDVGRLAVGQEAVLRADAFPGRTFRGEISEITPQGDSTGRVFRARLALDPGADLRPGMTVEANLVTGRRTDAVVIPTSAIRDGAVWTLVSGRARRVPIRTGAAGAERTEILSGLPPGAFVVVNPPANLKDGARLALRDRR